jgi:hypothetical protein
MKTTVYIDGQNFLYKAAEVLVGVKIIKDKQDLHSIDIPFLLNKVIDGKFEVRYYGVKKIRQRKDLGNDIYKKSAKFSDNLRRLRNCLKNTGVEYIEAGKLKVRDSDICKQCGAKDLRFQEKGVDVGLAVDIVRDSLLNQVDNIVLLSSDTDLIPAILIAKEAGKTITYVGFADKLTKGIVTEVNKTQVLRDNEVVEAYKIARK